MALGAGTELPNAPLPVSSLLPVCADRGESSWLAASVAVLAAMRVMESYPSSYKLPCSRCFYQSS